MYESADYHHPKYPDYHDYHNTKNSMFDVLKTYQLLQKYQFVHVLSQKLVHLSVKTFPANEKKSSNLTQT